MPRLNKERDLFVIPHPDDEIMLGHRIVEASEAWVVVATDGTASTIDHVGDDFVASGGRRDEAYLSLAHLGVPYDQQHYLGLPDGEVKYHMPELRDTVQRIIAEQSIRTVITLGPRGYDGHEDHVSSHYAVIEAVRALDTDRPEILSLNEQHTGEYVAKGDAWRKVGAMACHRSQFAVTDANFWRDFEPYLPLIEEKETYDRVAMRSSANLAGERPL